MNVTEIKHKGKDILFIDYTHCQTPKETIDILKELRQVFIESDDDATFLTLSDFSNAPVSNEFSDLAKVFGKEILDRKTSKSSCIGLKGIQKILLSGYNMFIKNKIVPFNTKEEALDYLVK